MTSRTALSLLALLLAATLPSPAGEVRTNSIGITLAPISAGSFQMGQAERQKSFRNPRAVCALCRNCADLWWHPRRQRPKATVRASSRWYAARD